jgi:endoglycosylceramidase
MRLAVAPLLLVAACGPKLTSLQPIPGRTDPNAVHVAGSVFRDGMGRQLLFRGYNAKVKNVFDAEFDDGRTPNETFPDFDEASAAKFEELGFDVMRLTINWSAIEPKPQQYSDAFFAKMEVVLDMARRHHFRLILDMHQDAYSKEIGEDGAPLWAIVPPPAQLLSGPSDDSRRLSPEVLTAGFNFFANAQAADGRALQDAFITAVAKMAQRWSFDPVVLGFEDFNEPVVLRQDDLDAFHARFADSMHVIDKDAPVLFEPVGERNQLDRAFMSPAPFAHGPGVYTVHIYTGIFSGADYASDWNNLRPSMVSAVAEAAAWGTPLFISEYGCDQTTTLGPQWMSHELDLQDEMLASSTAWAWEPGAWGIRDLDASQSITYKPQTIAVVSRPYPRAVAGDLVAITRPSHDQMIVRYENAIAAPHEVSASADWFPNGYTITCDGAPAQDVVKSIGRATFTCPTSAGDHTFEVTSL